MHQLLTAFAEAIRNGNTFAIGAAVVALLGTAAAIGLTLFAITETVFDTIAKWAPNGRLHDQNADLRADLTGEEEAHERTRADYDAVAADRDRLRELLAKIHGADLVAGIIHQDLRAHVDAALGLRPPAPKSAYQHDTGQTTAAAGAADPDAVTNADPGPDDEEAAARRAPIALVREPQTDRPAEDK